jgi:hypothetical protein
LGTSPCRRIADNRTIGLDYELIDQRRRRLATLEVRFDGSDRNFRKRKGGVPDLPGTRATEGVSCKALKARLEALRLIAYAASERRRPIALDEIVAAVKQEQARIIQMQACPGGRMKRGGKAVAGFDGDDEPLLIGDDGRQP